MITPAISVLSAVEGLTIVEAGLAPLVIPISIGILIGLFLVQSRGTAKVGSDLRPGHAGLFRGAGGARRDRTSCSHPEILGALSPHWAVRFFLYDPKLAFLALGSVFLAVTGAETLYADMGHFGAQGDRLLVAGARLSLPDAQLYGPGRAAARQSRRRSRIPSILMAPEWARLPLVGIATAATIIASQAVISGAFSVTHQAIQLGFLPRLRTEHTSEKAAGQIYIPAVNWGLLVDGHPAGAGLPRIRPASPRPMASR